MTEKEVATVCSQFTPMAVAYVNEYARKSPRANGLREDILQECYLDIIRKAKRTPSIEEFKYSPLDFRHSCSSAFRKLLGFGTRTSSIKTKLSEYDSQFLYLEDVLKQPSGDMAAIPDKKAQDEFDRTDTMIDMEAFVRSLHPVYRWVGLQRYYGKTLQEIANEMNVSVVYVGQILGEIKKKYSTVHHAV